MTALMHTAKYNQTLAVATTLLKAGADAMVKDGMDMWTAARIAQSNTGESLNTGRKPRGKTRK